MDIQYAQSLVFTPCDFTFPSNGTKAEATPNNKIILIMDVDLELLKELNMRGSVLNLPKGQANGHIHCSEKSELTFYCKYC
jgi:hypothetical protein